MADATSESKVQAIQDVYRIGYMNEEVRVSYKKDVKLAVGSVIVDAKEGDMSSIPRWLAKMLEKENAVEMQQGDIAAYISRTLNRERISRPHDLSGIDIDFYVRVNDYLENLKDRERDNLLVSLNTFVVSRLGKIVKLAAASPLSGELEGKLAAEERELYRVIHEMSVNFKQGVLNSD